MAVLPPATTNSLPAQWESHPLRMLWQITVMHTELPVRGLHLSLAGPICMPAAQSSPGPTFLMSSVSAFSRATLTSSCPVSCSDPIMVSASAGRASLPVPESTIIATAVPPTPLKNRPRVIPPTALPGSEGLLGLGNRAYLPQGLQEPPGGDWTEEAA
jgi:hypothetical protein